MGRAMAAPKFAPSPTIDTPRSYAAPRVVPPAWSPDRPGDLDGFQPQGEQLGYQGPDQGFALRLANRFRPRLVLASGEDADDVVAGCLGIALRRASLFSRAPVVHDLTVAFGMWGFLRSGPPADLLETRRRLFDGVSHSHHYAERRHLVDMVPEATLRLSHGQVESARPEHWRDLVGA